MTKPTTRSIWRARATRFGFGGAIFYAALYASAALGYRTFLFPRPQSGVEPVLAGTEVKRFDADGLPVVALWAAPKGNAPVVVFFHGNGDELVDLVRFARRFRDDGLGVFFVEYPGYGLAAGAKTTEATIYQVADRALQELRGMGYPNDRIVLLGQSLGTGVAVEMATRGYGTKLILVSPYTSITAMVKRFLPILPVSTFVTDRFDNVGKGASVASETLVVHGVEDALIPVGMGREVAASIPGARFEEIEGGTHNSLFRRDDRVFSLVVSFALARGREASAGRSARAN